ncbi:MAG: alpha/beta hydrolase [Pseudomonadota bacterium]
MKFIRSFFVASLVAYCAALALLFVLQRTFLYPGGGRDVPPQVVGLPNVDVVSLETPDGETLTAWHSPADDGRPTVLFFHGNAGTLANRADVFRIVGADGTGVLAVSYRGYHGSTGSPTQDGLIADGLTAFDWLSERTDRIVLHGQSLGSGVAVQVAARRAALAVVLEVPFSAAVDVAANRYPIFPVRMLMKDQWRSRDIIGALDEPVVIAAAENDWIIPDGQAEQLFAAASEPKTFILLEGAGHNTAWRSGMWERVRPALEPHLAR